MPCMRTCYLSWLLMTFEPTSILHLGTRSEPCTMCHTQDSGVRDGDNKTESLHRPEKVTSTRTCILPPPNKHTRAHTYIHDIDGKQHLSTRGPCTKRRPMIPPLAAIC